MSDSAEAASSPQSNQVAVAVRDMAQRLPDGTIFVPKPTQRVLAIRTLFTEEQEHPGTVELPARVIPDPNASGFVQSSQGGRLTPPEGGFPRLGAKVEAGQVLAEVMPVIGAADLNSQEAQLREVEQEISLIESKLKRYRKLKEVVSVSAVEDAELELEGLKARKTVLASATAEPEKLVAPVSGVIASVNAVAGQIAEPSAVIFQIIDPTRYWVEALSYQALPITGEGEGRLADGQVLKVSYRGTGLADRNQAVPIQFEIEGEARMLQGGPAADCPRAYPVGSKGHCCPAHRRDPGRQWPAHRLRPHQRRELPPPRSPHRAARRRARADRVRRRIPAGASSSQGAELLNQIR